MNRDMKRRIAGTLALALLLSSFSGMTAKTKLYAKTMKQGAIRLEDAGASASAGASAGASAQVSSSQEPQSSAASSLDPSASAGVSASPASSAASSATPAGTFFATLKVAGSSSKAKRTTTLSMSDESYKGLGKVGIYIWASNTDESTAVLASEEVEVTGKSMTFTLDVKKGTNVYGTWNAKAVFTPATGKKSVLANTEYKLAPTCSKFLVVKNKKLEKAAAFRVSLQKAANAYGIKKVVFHVYNEKNADVLTETGKLNDKKTKYIADISLKKLKYRLVKYTVKAVITDSTGKDFTLVKKVTADENIQKGTIRVKKKEAVGTISLRGAYMPGNIKKVQMVVYHMVKGKYKKKGTYDAKLDQKKTSYVADITHEDHGKYRVKAIAYTAWDTPYYMGKEEYTFKKSEMGKNGWKFIKYAGKKYKVYYKNNQIVTDLTKILNIKESNSSNENHFYIEVNRAACTVTVYAYDSETKKYDIPVRCFAVSVGRDTSTVAGTSGLNENSSYTPVGTYSICSNGQTVKYTLKTMNEPDGSVCYARWASHIVGNVYFHAVAVSAQSHYALSASNYNRLGSPASAGCIRMQVADAKWIYDYASSGSVVKIVKGNSQKPGPLGKPTNFKINGVSYDPTDPAVPLSRKKADFKAGRINGYLTKSGKRVTK